jgi:hypothetical protein
LRQLPSFLRRPPLQALIERDIDTLLVASLTTSEAVADCFREICGLPETALITDQFRGVVDRGTETDILVLGEFQDRARFAILLENKIDAGFQPKQAERCRLRGQHGQEHGWWDQFKTCLFAPRLYLEGCGEQGAWHVCIAYEDFASLLDSKADPLAKFLASVLAQAVEKHGRQCVDPSAEATQFWRQYRAFAAERYGHLTISGVGAVQSRSTAVWPNFAVERFPAGVRLEHKPHKGFVDLTFKNKSIEEVEAIAALGSYASFKVAKTGESVAIRLTVPPVQTLEPFDLQREGVEAAFEAVELLLRLYSEADGSFVVPVPHYVENAVSALTDIVGRLHDRPIPASDGPHSLRIARVAENLIGYLQSGRGQVSNDRLLHIVSRVGVFSRTASVDLSSGHLEADQAAWLMGQLAEIGDVAFDLWMQGDK